MIDSYNQDEFRADLQMMVNIAVGVKTDGYTNGIISACDAIPSLEAKQVFLSEEQKAILADPQLREVSRIKAHLPAQIEAILQNPLPFWELRKSTTVEGFLAKVTALQDAVNVLFVGEKIKVLEEIRAQIVAVPDEKTEVLKKDKPSVQTLPSIEEAVKNPAILSVIWGKCASTKGGLKTKSRWDKNTMASMKDLVFDIDGNFIWEGKGKHAVLLAFSTAMKQQNLLLESVTQTDFYYILCQKFGVEPASRIDKIPNGTTKFIDFLNDFKDFLEELKEK